VRSRTDTSRRPHFLGNSCSDASGVGVDGGVNGLRYEDVLLQSRVIVWERKLLSSLSSPRSIIRRVFTASMYLVSVSHDVSHARSRDVRDTTLEQVSSRGIRG
jgi:hypothetical protein